MWCEYSYRIGSSNLVRVSVYVRVSQSVYVSEDHIRELPLRGYLIVGLVGLRFSLNYILSLHNSIVQKGITIQNRNISEVVQQGLYLAKQNSRN